MNGTAIVTTIHPGGGRTRALGGRTKAQAVAEFVDSWSAEEGPAGMTFIGDGCYKVAWTDGRHVYKAPYISEDNGYEAPDYIKDTLFAEFDESERLAAEGVPWAAPTSMYVFDGVPVLVQPRYHSLYHTSRYPRYLTRQQQEYAREASRRFSDMYEGNYLYTKAGEVRVIDFAGHTLV